MNSQRDHSTNREAFIDYYEVLQLSPNADTETIEKVFRILAKRYHTDNQQTGNLEKFDQLVKAYQILSDPEKRAAFDVRYEKEIKKRWEIYSEAEVSSADGFEFDKKIQHGILSLLYTARRRDARDAGMGVVELEKLLNCPKQHMDFHLWYLKEKGWIRVNDSGQYVISAEGVDAALNDGIYSDKRKYLPPPSDQNGQHHPAEANGNGKFESQVANKTV